MDSKKHILKTLVISGKEVSPIRYIFDRLNRDSDYSLEKYWSDIEQLIYPQERIEDKQPVSEAPKRLVSNIAGHRSFKIIIALTGLLVVIGIVFGWYYNYGPCGTQLVKKATLELYDNTDKFFDAYKVAKSTSRIALSNPISDMQEIERNTRLIEVPACLENSKDLLATGMQNYTDGLIAFMGQADETDVNLYIATGDLYISATTNEVNYISECVPFCIMDPEKRNP